MFHNCTIILAVLSLCILITIQFNLVSAQSNSPSGYDHGCSNGD